MTYSELIKGGWIYSDWLAMTRQRLKRLSSLLKTMRSSLNYSKTHTKHARQKLSL